jgi:hypothetical protein
MTPQLPQTQNKLTSAPCSWVLNFSSTVNICAIIPYTDAVYLVQNDELTVDHLSQTFQERGFSIVLVL